MLDDLRLNVSTPEPGAGWVALEEPQKDNTFGIVNKFKFNYFVPLERTPFTVWSHGMMMEVIHLLRVRVLLLHSVHSSETF